MAWSPCPSTSSWATAGRSPSGRPGSSPSAPTRRPSWPPISAGCRSSWSWRWPGWSPRPWDWSSDCPAARLRGHYLAVATLGFGLAVPEIALNGGSLTGGYTGLIVPPQHLGSVMLNNPVPVYYLALAVLLVSAAAIRGVLASPTGRRFMAVRDSQDTAPAMGINTGRTKVILFTLSAFFCGLAGYVFALNNSIVEYSSFDFSLSLFFFAAVIVGGLGSMWGSLIGGGAPGRHPAGSAVPGRLLRGDPRRGRGRRSAPGARRAGLAGAAARATRSPGRASAAGRPARRAPGRAALPRPAVGALVARGRVAGGLRCSRSRICPCPSAASTPSTA